MRLLLLWRALMTRAQPGASNEVFEVESGDRLVDFFRFKGSFLGK
jgi:hypothetical protein